MIFLPLHSRLARAALGWGVREFADKAEVSPDTIARLERGEVLKPATVEKLCSLLEGEGIIFIAADEEAGPGVRVKDREATNVPSAA